MDFVVGFSRTSRGVDNIWVIIDLLANNTLDSKRGKILDLESCQCQPTVATQEPWWGPRTIEKVRGWAPQAYAQTRGPRLDQRTVGQTTVHGPGSVGRALKNQSLTTKRRSCRTVRHRDHGPSMGVSWIVPSSYFLGHMGLFWFLLNRSGVVLPKPRTPI
ncbi:hypothetical protein MTR67_007565 [Solanum verrucosum]|uniref:Uncharacterized protein n=1 Tax=Solanum verrucosum TaxID=315347 RepID=A0AAF0Q280_SOLVR|nr:hypothetical protein MTR67_007565 [Solanum verrucosum]